MFKYGSFRLFIIKTISGLIFVSFSILYFGSLLSINNSDPGFGKYSSNISNDEIANYFGYVGSYLSSFSNIFFGKLSYLINLFIFIEGLKLVLGIITKKLFIKFLTFIVGVLLLGFSLYSLNFNFFGLGLVSEFMYELYLKNLGYLISYFFIELIFLLVIMITSITLVLLSFSVKYNNIKVILKIFGVLRYLNVFKPFVYLIKTSNKKRVAYENPNSRKKNEPTIKRQEKISSGLLRNKQMNIGNKIKRESFTFSLPSIDLLSMPTRKANYDKQLDKFNQEAVVKLEKTLSEYGVDGKIINYKYGPIVTLFEFVPNAGIKSSKVIGLSDDIARAMSSLSARISSQPGKTSLGIEIPNLKRDGVLFGDVIDDQRFFDSQSLTLALGKDISGEKIFADLEKMPHLLIAGTTGSGKSVGINTMILSLLFKFHPNECKLILIDPKMLELSIYEDIPHLLTPVVTDPNKAVFSLKWVVREMENRYKLMSSMNVKNINSFNNKVLKTLSSGRKLYREVQTGVDYDTKMPIIEKREIPLEKMPYIVVVIDEMADLMMVAGKEVENLVQRLAQMARASGIHLITATQRPSVDVITGTIKANFPSRISYKVASKFDSRTILNEMGAEQLLGSGDMLFLENGGNIKRLHGGFVSENEVENIVKYIKSQATFDYNKGISVNEGESINESNDLISNNTDELYTKAVNIVLEQQRVSTSYIQRYLQIGYNRAARIIEKMEDEGIISEANNAGKRQVIKKN